MTATTTLLLIDAGLEGLADLLAGLDAGVRPVLVQRNADPFAVIAAELAVAPAERLALLAHGTPGWIALGRTPITTALLRAEATRVAAWRVSAIDLFSCQVGLDAAFVATLAELSAFVATLAELSGAAVQASTGLVGHEALGGSWQLHGPANAVVPFSRAARAQWRVTLGATVNLEAYAEDTLDAQLKSFDVANQGAANANFKGFLITANAASASQGTWEYSTDGGTTWTAVQLGSRWLYLAAGAKLRFNSAPDYYGAVGSLTYRDYTGSTALTSGTRYLSTGLTGFSTSSWKINQAAITGVADATTVSSSDRAYAEGEGAVLVNSGLTLADADNLLGAAESQRVSAASATATYTAATGVLAFDFSGVNAGTATAGSLLLSEVETLLRGVTFSNASDDPTNLKGDTASTSRTVTWSVTPTGEAAVTSTTTLVLTAVNDGADVAFAAGANPVLLYTERDGADSTANDTALGATVNDGDSKTYRRLTVRWDQASIKDAGQESLYVNGVAGASYALDVNTSGQLAAVTLDGVQYLVTRTDEGTGSTRLVFEAAAGTVTEAQLNALLNALRYNHASDNPTNGANRQFSLQIHDGDNISAGTRSFSVNVVKTNDTPTINVVDVAGAITEGAATLTDNGAITFADRDLADRPTAAKATKTVTAVKADGTALALSPEQTAAITAAFTITAAAGNTNNGQTNWDYTITEAALDFLAKDEVVTAVFTVTVNDGSGKSASQDVTVTITGTNDIPDITIGDGDSADAPINETNTVITATGKLSVVDADLSNTVTAAVDGVVVKGTSTFAGTNPLSNAALKAMLSVTAGAIAANSGDTNNITWDFSSGTAGAFDFLAAGETLVLEYTVKVTDSNAVGATDTQV
ncbi:MAG: hypothetical protein RLZZ516_2444, partial [Cyanobacteriota bacterium]